MGCHESSNTSRRRVWLARVGGDSEGPITTVPPRCSCEPVLEGKSHVLKNKVVTLILSRAGTVLTTELCATDRCLRGPALLGGLTSPSCAWLARVRRVRGSHLHLCSHKGGGDTGEQSLPGGLGLTPQQPQQDFKEHLCL